MSKCAVNHIGETNKANNGQMMTIVAWHGFSNIDIQFDDGTIVYGKRYDHFKQGYVNNPKCPPKRVKPGDRVGQTNRASNGLMMTIEVYRNAHDIDVRFENGELVQHKGYKEFLTGTIGCAGHGRFTGVLAKYAGKKIKATNGQMMEVVGGTSHRDLTIRFEDGTEVCHIRSSSFYEGTVINPNYTKYDVIRNDYIGMTNKAKNGLMMTIVEYRSANDIDIMFEDGAIVYHRQLLHFREGNIKHPTVRAVPIKDHTGETMLAKCGLHMKIVDYQAINDAKIQFETGYITSHKYYYNFVGGRIGHPFPYQLGDMTLEEPAYIHSGVGNFYCRCNKCHKVDILSITEIRNHTCK